MEDVSPLDMEGKTIALTSCTIANEARDVVKPDVTLHWDDLELSTDSTEALTVGAEPSSDVLTTPSVRRVDAVEKGTAMSSTTKVPSTVSPTEGSGPIVRHHDYTFGSTCGCCDEGYSNVVNSQGVSDRVEWNFVVSKVFTWEETGQLFLVQ